MRAVRVLAALSLLALAVAACRSEETILSSQNVVSGIPWRAPEEARYRLMDGDDVKGSGILRIESQGEEFTFTQSFESDEFHDEIVAVADAETLRPRAARRAIDGPEGARRGQVE